MHKKGTAVRQRQKAAPALTASPRTGGARPPDPPSPRRDPRPGRPRPPYLRRCPQARVAPGRGAAVVIHEEGPAGLRVDLDLPAGGQRLGAALHLRRRRGLRGGAHGGALPGGAAPAALSAGAGGGGAGLELSGNGGGGGGTRGGTRRRRRAEEPAAGNFWLCPARLGGPPGQRGALAGSAAGGSGCTEGSAAHRGVNAAPAPAPARPWGLAKAAPSRCPAHRAKDQSSSPKRPAP